MATIEPVKVENLKELQWALKRTTDGMQKRMRLVLNEAAQVVVDDVQGLVPRRTGAARASIKARSGQREAVIQAGGRKAPWYPWLDFGGKVGRNRSVERRFIKEGRYIWPTLDRKRTVILEMIDEGMADLAREAGLDVER